MNESLLNELIEKTLNGPLLFADCNVNTDSGILLVEGEKVLHKERLITVRSDTGCNHVPEHNHDYVEIVYMYSGSKTNIVNGDTVVLNEGEILFLSQNCKHENLPSGDNDTAINFIVLPHFFDRALEMLGEEETLLHRFIVQCLSGENGKSSYLHFKVSHVLPVKNLVETLVWNLLNESPDQRKINENTMGLLLLQLLNHIDMIEYSRDISGLVFHVLQYVDAHFADGSLTELSDLLFYDFNTLSKQIKKLTGKTYTELVQEKRLFQACSLLKSTKLGVAEISRTIGYENISYFHRLFNKAYGMSPKKFRDKYR